MVEEPAIDDSIPQPTEPTYIEDGLTGGTFTSPDGLFSVVVPAGSIPKGLRANPAINETSVDSSALLSGGETLVSKAYQFDTKAISNLTTTNTVEVTIPFNSTNIPTNKLKPPYVYAKIYHPSNQASVPVLGTISGSTLKIQLKGFAQNAVFTVVYNPSIRTSLSSSSALQIYSTQNPPWQTNRWMLWYDSTDTELRNVVAGILGISAASLTDAQIDSVVKPRVADNAAAAGAIYQAAGFRQPNITTNIDPFFTGTTEAVFFIYLTSGGSKFQPGDADENVDLLGISYGQILLDPKRIDDTASDLHGTVLASLAHEMFHAIQSGYDIGSSVTTNGFDEGMATTYGMTIDQSAVEPQVRTVNSTEIHKMSSFLLAPNSKTSSFGYANQDFFAYVGRVYGSNRLSYLQDVLAQAKTDIDALVASGTTTARISPPYETLLQSLDAVFDSKYNKKLPYVYFDYVKKRAMEHSVASELRPGEPNPMTLNTGLFHKTMLDRRTVDPEYLKTNFIYNTFNNMPPFSTGAVIITPSKTVDDVHPYLFVIPNYGSTGTSVKAVVYRGGVATEFSSPLLIRNFGSTANDILTILISNVDNSQDISFTYNLGPTPGPPNVDTFEATVTIKNTDYPFSPITIVGGFGSYSSPPFVRNNLPAIAATEGAPGNIHVDMISIVTDPNTITSTGVPYDFNEGDKVFQQSIGEATLIYSTPAITNVDDGTEVGFDSNGGTITFSSYSTTAGDRLIGTFSANVTGTRDTNQQGQPHTSETLTGTISGYFDVELTSSGITAATAPACTRRH
ncbi:MAG: hypothetical protein PHH60_01640 [Candidatus Margulisbacteria bacterium]|nr:hypothetical protein [Candidatus Margulisiibacteriota bacterium]